jgi:uncharacterized protein YbcI
VPGFRFSYRISGKSATVKTFVFKNTETLSRGDMLNLEDGKVDLGATGDSALIGAAVETVDGEAGTTAIQVIVDADAVYGVEDPSVRSKRSMLDLKGPTGAQGLGASVNADFVVDVDTSANEETLVRIGGGRHYEQLPTVGDQERLIGGALNAAIARSVVRYHAEQRGRGPTKAQAFHRDNVIVVVLQGVMTQAERSLVDGARADAMLHARQAFHEIMHPFLRSTVERMTGCKVRAFMSADHVDPDLAAELFILDRPVPGSRSPGRTQVDRD